MKDKEKNTPNLRDSLEESRIKSLEKSFQLLVDVGPQNWVQNYTLSKTDKFLQLEAMRKHFQELEEYEKCQYVVDVKNSLDTHNYML
jgi:hypothetical protein